MLQRAINIFYSKSRQSILRSVRCTRTIYNFVKVLYHKWNLMKYQTQLTKIRHTSNNLMIIL